MWRPIASSKESLCRESPVEGCQFDPVRVLWRWQIDFTHSLEHADLTDSTTWQRCSPAWKLGNISLQIRSGAWLLAGRIDPLEAMAEGGKLVQEGGFIHRDWTTKQIDDELRDHGLKVSNDGCGYAIQKWLGFEMEISPRIARGKFLVTEKCSEPNGQLIRGIAGYLAESIGSAAGSFASRSKKVAGVELNLNNLQPAYVGQEVIVFAKPLKKRSGIQTWEIRFETEPLKEQTPATKSQGEHQGDMVLVAIARFTLVEQSFSPEGVMTTLQKMLMEKQTAESKQ